MWVGVLGTTLVVRDTTDEATEPVEMSAAKHRALVAALALHAPRPASPEALVEAVWGPEAPASAGATLQTYISVVRRTLEPDLPARTPSSYLASVDGGYRLLADTDAAAFAATVNDVHAGLGPLGTSLVPVADDAGALDKDIERLAEALACWRGEAYDDLPDSDLVGPERARLQALRVLAHEDRAALLVAAGRDAEAVAALESLTRAHPLRERPWLLLAVALARTGRQAEALGALDELRATLDAELGLEPSGDVNELQTAILRHELPRPRRQPEAVGAAGPEPVRIALPAWPLVGREQHLEVLAGLLDQAGGGEPSFVSLVGEPGAGKSRLGAELAVRAHERGALVLVGRCSEDEDAPPLWPWRQALGDAVVDQPAEGLDHDAARFAVAESVRRALTDLSRDRTVVLGLEDLHWADSSSLRVLRHVIAHLDSGRLLVLATWRRGATAVPAGQALAEVVEALARRHATSLEVAGLSEVETQELMSELAGDADPAVVAALHRRTEGNPFFLIEYGRLARDERRGLSEAIEGVPPTVAAVVTRRIAQLPARTSAALTAGAVIGREFSVDLLARALESEELALLDLLQPAVDGDLVRDVGGDVFRFGHALARDAAYGTLTASRRERLHALIAGMVEEAPDAATRAPEIARHWAAAGPRHVGRAWRAAARAGAHALSAHAADEAAGHLDTALALHAEDPAGTSRERYDLLVEYAAACRWSTQRLEMHRASDEATLLAGELGDPELVVRAASVPVDDALWPARRYGESNDEVVAVIRQTLATLPVEDSTLRCRLLLALASESYYVARPAETDRIIEEAVGMARRLADASGDVVLLAEALLACVVAWWRPDRAVERAAMLEECRQLAEEAGEDRLEVNARCLLASARCELGDVDGIDEELAGLADMARAHRLYFAELILVCHAHSWSAMRGDVAAIQWQVARLVELDEQLSMVHKEDSVQGALLYVPLWDRNAPPLDDMVQAFLGATSLPLVTAAVALFLRQGRTDLARATWAGHTFDADTLNWYSPVYWAFSAEAALGLDDPAVGAAVYGNLRPYRGRCVMSGTNPALGPVDAYLAVAAAAAGDTALATEVADRALEQLRTWRIPQVEKWFLGLRDQHGF
jgi:DNA-binding SARP family transcriptional activator